MYMQYLIKVLKITEIILNKYKTGKFDPFTYKICSLTCIAFYSSPPRFTQGTVSTLNVTRVVFAVGGTRDVTVTAVDTAIITT